MCDWAETYAGDIQSAHALDVGWEIWAQVALALHINGRLGGRYVTRSAGIYQANAFADIVVWNGPNKTGAPVHVVELKCRGPNDSDADFRAELNDDQFNLTQNAMNLQYQPARKWCIGINIGNQLTGLGGNWNKQPVDLEPIQVYYRTFI